MLTGSKSRRGWRVNFALLIMALLTVASPLPTLANVARSQPSQPPQAPTATCPPDGQCFADVPSSNPFSTFINRIYQQDLVSGYDCGGLGEPCDGYNRPYYRPVANVTRSQMAKFIDNGRRLAEIHIEVASGPSPIYARNNTSTAISAYSTSGQALTAQSTSQVAVYAQTGEAAALSGYSTGSTDSSFGVYGSGHTGVRGQGSGNSASGVYGNSSGTGSVGVRGYGPIGVQGEGPDTNSTGVYGVGHGVGDGVSGRSSSANGVYGDTDTGVAIYGWAHEATGWAAWFVGNVRINGTCCSMGAATTQIDDPLDPANKYLNQSLVQSPDMSTVLNNNVTLDAKGEATVSAPAWFVAANSDFRYQLTAVDAPGPNLYIARKMAGGSFKIAGGAPGAEVSWQLTGIRQDAYAKAHPTQVEQEKPASEQGKYLHPTELGHPESQGIGYDKRQQMQRESQQPAQANP